MFSYVNLLATTPQLHFIDEIIVIGFLVLVTLIGVFMSKMASKGLKDYFLGGRTIPWWVLGISTATSNFDMTGTMVIVSMVYLLGYRGYLVELRGGVGLSLAFLMVFLGKWLRRSRVMTSAQWMKIRFGTDKAGKAAHILSAVAQSLLALGMIVYFCVGGGKFLEYFLPWNKNVCTAIMVAVGLFYTLLSGLYGVVFTDVIQMIILSFTAIYLAVKGFSVGLTQLLSTGIVPKGWLGFDLTVPQAVQNSIKSTHIAITNKLQTAIQTATSPSTRASLESTLHSVSSRLASLEPMMYMFALVIVFYFLRTTMEGFGGVGGYTDQRFFAARNEREACYLTLESIIISILRWAMVGGLVALGYWLVYKVPSQFPQAVEQIKLDPEKVLPVVIGTLLPIGIKGFVLAGLIAAAMSTFDSTLNAGASYLVVDIYQSYINPKASMKKLVRASHIATIALAALGVILAWVVPNINEIWDFITMALGAGMFTPLFLRWYWPRYNGWGFAWGTGAGMVTALLFKFGVFDKLPVFWGPLGEQAGVPMYKSFPTIILVSFIASIVASLLTKPVDEDTLVNFYVQINPFGFWGKYAEIAYKKGLIDKVGRFKRIIEILNDFISTCFAVPFQFTILLATLAFIFHDWSKFFIFFFISFICSIGLYFFWFKNLKSHEECEKEDKLYIKDEETESQEQAA